MHINAIIFVILNLEKKGVWLINMLMTFSLLTYVLIVEEETILAHLYDNNMVIFTRRPLRLSSVLLLSMVQTYIEKSSKSTAKFLFSLFLLLLFSLNHLFIALCRLWKQNMNVMKLWGKQYFCFFREVSTLFNFTGK